MNNNKKDIKKSKKLEQQNKLRFQRQKQQMQTYKNKLMPLVKFLKQHGLRFNYARIGQNRVEYFRLDDYNKLKDQYKEKIQANKTISQLIGDLTNHDFFYYNRPGDMKNIKYPNRLEPVAYSGNPPPKFCSFKFDSTVSRKWLVLASISSVLALVLFPVWPYLLKYGIWLFTLYLLIFLVSLIAFRLFVYLICVVMGFNVWIFPNLLGDAGFIDSFKPFFYAERWQRSIVNIIIRVSALLFFMFYGYQIYLDPNIITDNLTVTKSAIDDIHDWGVGKIKNEVKFSQRAITDLQDILNETADVSDEKQQQYYQQGHQNSQNIQVPQDPYNNQEQDQQYIEQQQQQRKDQLNQQYKQQVQSDKQYLWDQQQQDQYQYDQQQIVEEDQYQQIIRENSDNNQKQL